MLRRNVTKWPINGNASSIAVQATADEADAADVEVAAAAAAQFVASAVSSELEQAWPAEPRVPQLGPLERAAQLGIPIVSVTPPHKRGCCAKVVAERKPLHWPTQMDKRQASKREYKEIRETG